MEGNNIPAVTESGKPSQDLLLPRQQETGSTFNLKWLLTTVLAIWPWLLGSIIISLIIGNIYLKYYTPIFRASAELQINDQKKGGSGGDNVLDALKMDGNKISIDNEIEILKSRATMTKIVKLLNLNVTYSIEGRFKRTELYTKKPFEFIKIDSFDEYYSCKVNILSDDEYLLTENTGRKIRAH